MLFFGVVASFVNVESVNASLGGVLADDTMFIRMVDNLDSGLVNFGVMGGSAVLFKTGAEILSGVTEFSCGIHNAYLVRVLFNLLDGSELTC